VGRLSPEKDPLLAVAALDELRRSCAATLDVYGAGPLDGRLRALEPDRPWLRLHGERPWSDVLAAQAGAHACLSTSAWDNVQVAVLETLARGIPTVATSVGDAPTYYREAALAGCCVEPGDARALAGALSAIAADDGRLAAVFARNAAALRAVHDEAPRVLAELVAG
jgi:glycosyltransferase involved in cell wall biosynthesis